MRTFATYIEYLLMTRHYCFVPGKGAYMLADEPAIVSGVPGIGTESRRVHNIQAPRRIVRFSPLHAHDDGMLANLLMEAEGMTYDEACHYIERQAPLLSDDFADKAALRTDTDNFGFDDVSLEMWTDIEQRLQKSAAAAAAPAASQPAIPARNSETIAIPKYWVKRAAVAVLIAVFFFSNFIDLDRGNIRMASVLNTSMLRAVQTVALADADDDVTTAVDADDMLAAVKTAAPQNSSAEQQQRPDMTASAMARTAATATAHTAPSDVTIGGEETLAETIDQKSYYIIVASTHSENEAIRICRRYNDNGYQHAGILIKDDLYRVYTEHYAVYNEALDALREIRTQSEWLKKAWLLPMPGGSLSYIIKNKHNDNQLSMELSHPNLRTERDQG